MQKCLWFLLFRQNDGAWFLGQRLSSVYEGQKKDLGYKGMQGALL